jgi:hypothetical protein
VIADTRRYSVSVGLKINPRRQTDCRGLPVPTGVVFFGPSTAQAQTPGESASVPGFAFALMLPVSNGNKQVLVTG